MQETGDEGSVLHWEGPLEGAMATHSSILAWEIPWTEESGRLQSMESQRIKHNLLTEHTLTYTPMYISMCIYP